MIRECEISRAQERFGELISQEFERIEGMKAGQETVDFEKLNPIIIGVLPGDGIGPIIMEQAMRVLKSLMASELESGRLEIREIQGMTIENRAAKNQSLPDEVMEEVKQCHVLLKGAHGDPQGLRSLAQSGECQQPVKTGAGAVCRRPPHPHPGKGH